MYPQQETTPSKISKWISYISFSTLVMIATYYSLYSLNRLILSPPVLSGLGYGDAIEYWSAFNLWIDGLNPYNDQLMLELQSKVTDTKSVLMMWNPPWLLTLFSPLLSIQNFLDFTRVWFLASLCAYLFGAWYLIKSLIPEYKNDLTLWILILTFAPFLTTLSVGQIGTWLFLGVSLVIVGITKRNALSLASGAIIISIKPHLFLVFTTICLLALLKRKDWRLLAYFCLCPLALWLFTDAISSNSLSSTWLQTIFSVPAPQSAPRPQSWITTTVPSVLSELIDPSNVNFKRNFGLVSLLISLFLSVWALLCYNLLPAISISLLISIPLGPFGWLYDYTIISACLIMAWPIIREKKDLINSISCSFLFLLLYCTIIIQRLEQALPALLISIFLLLWINLKLKKPFSIA